MGRKVGSFENDHLLTCFLHRVPKTIKISSCKDGYSGLHPKWQCHPKGRSQECFHTQIRLRHGTEVKRLKEKSYWKIDERKMSE